MEKFWVDYQGGESRTNEDSLGIDYMLCKVEVDNEEIELYAECEWENFLRTDGKAFLDKAFKENKEDYYEGYESGEDVLDSNDQDLRRLISSQTYDVIDEANLIDSTWSVYSFRCLKEEIIRQAKEYGIENRLVFAGEERWESEKGE